MMRARSRREPPLASLARWLRNVSRLRFMRSRDALSAAHAAMLPPKSEKPQPARCARLRALAISSPCLAIAESYFLIWPGLARPPSSMPASSVWSCRHRRDAAVAWPMPAQDKAMAPSSTARYASLPAPPFICPPRRMQDVGAARQTQVDTDAPLREPSVFTVNCFLVRGFFGRPVHLDVWIACAFCVASTTASAVMLTTPREVTEGVRIWAGLSVPSRIG